MRARLRTLLAHTSRPEVFIPMVGVFVSSAFRLAGETLHEHENRLVELEQLLEDSRCRIFTLETILEAGDALASVPARDHNEGEEPHEISD